LLPLKLGVSLWSQGTTWPAMLHAGRDIDRAGYAYLFTQDHLYATFGDWRQPVFEGWTLLGALAQATRRVQIGLLVGANTLRHPGLTAKMAVTLDHVSWGRAVLGLGAGWFEPEHRAHGIPFGASAGERLGWLDESASAVRALLQGQTVDQIGPGYTFRHAQHAPLPLRPLVPILIGGSGEQRTLRTVARSADIWNAMGSVDTLRRKAEILDGYCETLGRDPESIERSVTCKMIIRRDPSAARQVWEAALAANHTAPGVEPDPWLGPPEVIAERIAGYRAIGVTTVVVSLPWPYDAETIHRLRDEVVPLITPPTAPSASLAAAGR
jgi:alkanesulfonate monooxygenase SsuD/methylene tetrahydromethanopterin reductase-like flavin-dependent oxidoreductase (luciferase family)